MTTIEHRPARTRRLPQAALTAAAVATVTNLAIWAASDAALDPIRAPGDGAPVALGWYAVIAATVVGVALATVVLVLVRRLAPAPREAFIAAVAIGTLLSLGGPLSGDLDTGNRVALAAMHLVTGTVAVSLLAATLPVRSRR